jgi:hypothetical protein
MDYLRALIKTKNRLLKIQWSPIAKSGSSSHVRGGGGNVTPFLGDSLYLP